MKHGNQQTKQLVLEHQHGKNYNNMGRIEIHLIPSYREYWQNTNVMKQRKKRKGVSNKND